MPMIGIVGDLGTGKSALMTLFDCMEIWMGRLIFTNFHVRYVSPWNNKSHYVPPSILLEWFKSGKVRFPLEGATVYIDEAYMYMESRAPSKQTTEFTYMILQSRKMGANVVFAVQLTSCLTPDTIIQYADGSYRPIEQITTGDEIIDYGIRGPFPRLVKSVRRTTTSKLVDIKLQSGHSISCTPEHLFPVYESYRPDYPTTWSHSDVEADCLKIGDYLAIDSWPSMQLNINPIASLMGIISAEGSWKIDYPFTTSMYTTKSGYKVNKRYSGVANQLIISINSNEIELKKFIITTLKSIIPDIHICVSQQTRSNGIAIAVSRKEHVHLLYKMYKDFISNHHLPIDMISYLKGMFEGDACPAHTVGNRVYSTIVLSQGLCNIDKLQLVQKYLQSLEVPFITSKQVRQNCPRCGKSHSAYHLCITSRDAGLFASRIGFLTNAKQSRMLAGIKSNYSRIESINMHSSRHQVIDISLSQFDSRSPYFMANGIRTHNSIDKRLKFLANYWILCNRVCLDGVHNDYHFEFMDNEGNTLNELYIREDAMRQTIYGLYDTQEIVTAAGEAEEAMTEEEMGEAYTAIAPFFLKNRQRYAQWMKDHIKPLVPQPQTVISQLQPANQYMPAEARAQIQPVIMEVKRRLKPIVRQVA